MSVELKRLPDGWQWSTLGKVTEIIAGQSPPGSSYRNTPDGLPFFQGKADFGLRTPIPRVWCVEPTKIALPGDILISVRAPVGPTNVADVECCIGRGLAAIRCDDDADRDYILYVLKHLETGLAAQGSGSTFGAISRDDIEDLVIPLPPLSEQQRIAKILRERMAAVEKARAAAQARMDAARVLLVALLRRVFPKPGQALSDGWQWRRLRELGHFEAGGTPSKGERELWGGSIPFVTGADITELRVHSKHSRAFLTNKGLNSGKTAICYPETVLIVTRTCVGRVGIVAEFMGVSQDITAFVCGAEIIPEFLCRYIHSIRDNLIDNCRGATIKGIDRDFVGQIPIPLASMQVQNRIVSTLREEVAIGEKACLDVEEEVRAIDSLPAALLRRAFNGEL